MSLQQCQYWLCGLLYSYNQGYLGFLRLVVVDSRWHTPGADKVIEQTSDEAVTTVKKWWNERISPCQERNIAGWSITGRSCESATDRSCNDKVHFSYRVWNRGRILLYARYVIWWSCHVVPYSTKSVRCLQSFNVMLWLVNILVRSPML